MHDDCVEDIQISSTSICTAYIIIYKIHKLCKHAIYYNIIFFSGIHYFCKVICQHSLKLNCTRILHIHLFILEYLIGIT